MFFFSFFPAVHFSVSLHINQAPLLFRHSEVGGDPHIQKQNFMTFHYPMGEFVGIGKQPKILCIHFYLTFFALLDQRPRSDSLLWFLMHHPISSTLSQFFSRVDPFPVFPSALLSKQLLPAIYQPVLLELGCQTSKGFLCIWPRTFFFLIYQTSHPVFNQSIH